MGQVPWLTRREERVWRLLAAVLIVLPDEVEAQLQRDADLTHFGYAVLSVLSEAPGRSLRMSELAHMANGSRSRLSHVVANLERRGWVRRERAAADGRGNLAVLTEAGHAKVGAIAPDHVATVRSMVFDTLNPRQLDELEGICLALLPPEIRENLHHLPPRYQQTSERHQKDDTRSRDEDITMSADDLPTLGRDAVGNEAAHRLTQGHGGGNSVVTRAHTLQRLLVAVRRAPAGDRLADHERPITSEDLTDGLALISDARGDVDLTELQLIDHARARGQTWEQIAAALGMPDRRQAQTRFRRLCERWPGYEPVSAAAR
jgi:DNA-binding MarR family transcriptional regulator